MKVLIIGGGAAGYFTALRYKSVFPKTEVELIRSKNINIIGVGESSLIDIPKFFINDCNIDINDFHNEVKPTFKLGLQTRDWSSKGKIVNYVFDFYYLMIQKGVEVINNIDNQYYTFFSTLISNKQPPITKKGELLVGDSSSIPYLHAYQIENKKFIPFLEKQAKLNGINEIEGEVLDIKQNEEGIESIYFNDNWHKYDFYVDCSGFNGCITNFIKNEWVSFNKYIICDSAIVGEHQIDDTPNHCTIAHAMTNGWMFQIDCEGRTGKGYIYNSSTITDEKAIEEYVIKNDFKIKSHRKINIKSGHYKNLFNKNYILVGNCAGFAEPLESTGYSVILNTVNLLIKNHKTKKENLLLTNSEIKCNNLFISKLWYEIINSILLHYKFNNNHDNDFWNYYKNLDFHGDYKYIIEYLLENDFNLEKSREININYLQNLIFPVEFIYLILRGKNIIKKQKKESNLIDFFKLKSNEMMSYEDLIKQKDYKKYYDNKKIISDFLNY